eukprot:TRINITY_DN1746_c0_g1_i1.p1 TRINITY_DN1746_c0_g1~~TRINITY_DN1746_c0_g1_i1.p1  ORF type:complete len:158 (+),score=37.91 TRINITY_DN1746_c0_g1_i1:49-522(+)
MMLSRNIAQCFARRSTSLISTRSNTLFSARFFHNNITFYNNESPQSIISPNYYTVSPQPTHNQFPIEDANSPQLIIENILRGDIPRLPHHLDIMNPPIYIGTPLSEFTKEKIEEPKEEIEELKADSVLKKRRRKMNKHKLKRVRKEQRFLRRKLQKI